MQDCPAPADKKALGPYTKDAVVKYRRLALLSPLLAAGLLAGCAGSLEQIVEARHQARIDAANASRPLTHGATDGLGASLADSAPGLTVSAVKRATTP